MRPLGAVSVSTGLLVARSSSTRLHWRRDGRPVRYGSRARSLGSCALLGLVLLAVVNGAVGVAPVADPASAGLRLLADLVEHVAPLRQGEGGSTRPGRTA